LAFTKHKGFQEGQAFFLPRFCRALYNKADYNRHKDCHPAKTHTFKFLCLP